MKKIVFFFLFFSVMSPKPLLAQFYTIQKIAVPIHVVAATDNAVPGNNSSVPAAPPADSLLADRKALLKYRLFLSCPLESDSLYVTSPYGYRKDPFTGKRKFHAGTDYRASSDNVYAMMPGRIKSVGHKKALGNYVELEHGDWTVIYGHLHTTVGKKGDLVKAGQSVGISGSTGRSTGEHLHVSISYKGKRVDPHPVITYIHSQTRLLDGRIAALPPLDGPTGKETEKSEDQDEVK